MTHPVVLSAISVQTKKKPPDLPTTIPLEWTMIMPAPKGGRSTVGGRSRPRDLLLDALAAVEWNVTEPRLAS